MRDVRRSEKSLKNMKKAEGQKRWEEVRKVDEKVGTLCNITTAPASKTFPTPLVECIFLMETFAARLVLALLVPWVFNSLIWVWYSSASFGYVYCWGCHKQRPRRRLIIHMAETAGNYIGA